MIMEMHRQGNTVVRRFHFCTSLVMCLSHFFNIIVIFMIYPLYRYIRSTMYHVPSTEEIRKQTGVPFGLVISPLARIQEGESEPPISDFGPSGPVRCMRCKGD